MNFNELILSNWQTITFYYKLFLFISCVVMVWILIYCIKTILWLNHLINSNSKDHECEKENHPR